ncbi:hypothetical protein N7517_008180 [Penicillium concentricum]|uniref:Uncharacterized protein n=1 Tax=Penicillium concentricum TaxID=293559 RepID=A0A9W9RU33_9EURO|nr:uncharacterized protein N7517_008180 [Penicillium concentricum]KAJ5365294.1 hypothetical protein N7517_008180 [Penicillium concentricum]
MVLSSNEKRAFFRQQCREALAAHILDRLDLVVAPSQVRLQPSGGDGYAWSITESKKSLLQSNLGSGSVGLYRSICEELGRSLEAVTPQTLHIAQSKRNHLPREEVSILIHQAPRGLHSAENICKTRPARSDEKDSGSFTAKIRELECANHEMSDELDLTRIHLEESSGQNRELQAKVRQLQYELECNSS